MGKKTTSAARQMCEDILETKIRYCIEHEILPSHVTVARTLLSRGGELEEAYGELHGKLGGQPHALDQLLELLLYTTAFWGPDKIAQARLDREELSEVNHDIAKLASNLATLLRRRDDLHNISGFSGQTHYHIAEVMHAAGVGIGHYQSFLKQKIEHLTFEYDLKYWPSLDKCLDVIAADARSVELEATDPLTGAATSGIRPSRTDFLKALFAAINECRRGISPGTLGVDFKLSDSTLASLVNCLLALPADDLVPAEYVKGVRQRARELAW